MLSLSNIIKRFGSTTALDGVSVTIAPGEIIGLVGENGAGKTTLMRIAAGELAPDSGSVRADGGIGFVHQHFLLVNEFTIAENRDRCPGTAVLDMLRENCIKRIESRHRGYGTRGESQSVANQNVSGVGGNGPC